MPTLDLRAQAGPYYLGQVQSGIHTFVGANEAHKCVNESAGTSHDGDTTYITVRTPALVSFPIFRMSEHFTVSSFLMRIVLKEMDPTPDLEVRYFLARQPGVENDLAGDAQVVGSVVGNYPSYALLSNAVTTSPWTGAPFAAEEIVPVQIGFFILYTPNGVLEKDVRITLVSGQATYTEPHNHADRAPKSASLG